MRIAPELAGSISSLAPCADELSVKSHDVTSLVPCGYGITLSSSMLALLEPGMFAHSEEIAIDIEDLTAIVLPAHYVNPALGVDTITSGIG